MTDEIYLLLKVPNVYDREAQLLAMILELMDLGPTGTPQRIEAKPPFDKLVVKGGSAMDVGGRKRIAKYLYERYGRGR